MAYSPLMVSVSTTGTPTIDQLAALLDVIDENFPERLGFLQIEFDLGGAGNVAIGNSAVSPTNCGRRLVPTMFQNIWVWQGLVLTTDVYFISSAATQQLNIIAVPAGA
jgi:hypothetical protein